SLAPVPDDEPRALAEAESRRVVPRRDRRAVRDIDADTARARIFVKQRDQQTAAAGAEIEKAVCQLAIRQLDEHRLDDRLGLGARIERLRRQYEVEAPELAPPDDAAQWLARRDPLRNRFDALSLFLAEMALRVREHFGRR